VILAITAALAQGCVPASLGAAFLVDSIRTPVIDTASLPHRPFSFWSGDVELNGWLFEPQGKPKGLVIFLHGRMANRAWGIGTAETGPRTMMSSDIR
jgi:poly(3-hydroxybutyrate) depolymerase